MLALVPLTILALAQVVIGAPAGNSSVDLVDNAPINWSGVLEEGQPPVNLTGSSFEDIEKQAKEINSTYTIFKNEQDKTEPATVSLASAAWDYEQHHFCDVGGRVRPSKLWDGVNYLRGIKGLCGSPPGPGFCGRVSCSYGAGINFCNDNPHEIHVPCARLGDHAAWIIERCIRWNKVSGQVFEESGYNVMIGRGGC